MFLSQTSHYLNLHRSVGSAESLIVVGEEFNRMVENIMEMGYERPQVSTDYVMIVLVVIMVMVFVVCSIDKCEKY